MERFEYTEENIRKMQLTETDMLGELDRICRKRQIPYIIDSGTLLGAVRHGGFIPWDDDIDVKMLRDDYDRFCQVCQEELGSKYFLQTYKTDKGYRWAYARILRNGTTFIREGHECLKSRTGIFIDIFPCDNMPDSLIMQKYFNFLALCCRKMLYSEVGAKSAATVWRRMGFSFLNLFPKSWAYRCLEAIAYKYNHVKTRKVRCYAWGSKEESKGQERRWFEKTKDMKFEDLVVKGPVKSSEMLEYYYGENYMKLPPKEERQPKHTAKYIRFAR